MAPFSFKKQKIAPDTKPVKEHNPVIIHKATGRAISVTMLGVKWSRWTQMQRYRQAGYDAEMLLMKMPNHTGTYREART